MSDLKRSRQSCQFVDDTRQDCLALMRERRWDEAAETATLAMRARPKERLWPILAARAYSAAGRHAKAMAMAACASVLPVADGDGIDTAEIWRFLGLQALLDNDRPAAIHALEQTIRFNPDAHDARMSLGLALYGP